MGKDALADASDIERETVSRAGAPTYLGSDTPPDSLAIPGLSSRFAVILDEQIQRARAADDVFALLLIHAEAKRPTGQDLTRPEYNSVMAALEELLRRLGPPSDSTERVSECRLGMILAGSNAVGAAGVSNKILRTVGATRVLAGRHVSIRARVGLALFPDHGSSPESLLHHAEICLRTR